MLFNLEKKITSPDLKKFKKKLQNFKIFDDLPKVRKDTIPAGSVNGWPPGIRIRIRNSVLRIRGSGSERNIY